VAARKPASAKGKSAAAAVAAADSDDDDLDDDADEDNEDDAAPGAAAAAAARAARAEALAQEDEIPPAFVTDQLPVRAHHPSLARPALIHLARRRSPSPLGACAGQRAAATGDVHRPALWHLGALRCAQAARRAGGNGTTQRACHLRTSFPALRGGQSLRVPPLVVSARMPNMSLTLCAAVCAPGRTAVAVSRRHAGGPGRDATATGGRPCHATPRSPGYATGWQTAAGPHVLAPNAHARACGVGCGASACA
jgi:hypothetical protein